MLSNLFSNTFDIFQLTYKLFEFNILPSEKKVAWGLTYSCGKTKGNTLVHKECTRFKLGVHY